MLLKKGGSLSANISLKEELGELQKQVRGDASNAKLRVHLFQLLCLLGDWQRALAQLQVCAQLDAKALPMAQAYREAIRCETFRNDVFAGKRSPQVFGAPPSWLGLMIEALRLDGTQQNASSAMDLRMRALEEAEATPCTIDGVACEWVADGDSRLGPICEVIVNGQYYWLPFESCSAIKIDPPTDLRDLVWAPAELSLPNQGRVPAFIPSRYPETAKTELANGDALRRCKATEWVENQPDLWSGLGQRMWTSDVAEHPILDTREMVFAPKSAATT